MLPPARVPPLHTKFYLLRISIFTAACVFGFCSGWVFKDPFVKLVLGDQKATKQVAVVEQPPVIQLTPEQEKFWAYLEQFNRLPDNPTEEMIAVTKTKGIAPEFHYLKTSKTSVIGDIKGLTAHREQFIKRYSWVQPLLDQYAIEIPISEDRFSGTIKEIADRYWRLSLIHRECAPTPENEKLFVKDYLEGMLVVDYIYACGTETNKRESMMIVENVFCKNYLFNPLVKKLEPALTSHASRDIGWAIIADYPELCRATVASNVSRGFFEYSSANKIDFYKWMTCTKGIPEMNNPERQDLYRGMIHNELVRTKLLSYSIYCAHNHEVGRPENAPWLVVIKILFKRLYPKDHAIRYKEYLTLLDAAYPQIAS